MVYVVNDGRKVVASRSGNNNFLSACIDMSLCFCFGGVESGTLQNYVYTNLAPRKLCSVCFCVDFDLFAINSDRILTSLYSVSQCVFALSGIIF